MLGDGPAGDAETARRAFGHFTEAVLGSARALTVYHHSRVDAAGRTGDRSDPMSGGWFL